MNVKECYEKMGSDYTAVLGRLGSDVSEVCIKVSE